MNFWLEIFKDAGSLQAPCNIRSAAHTTTTEEAGPLAGLQFGELVLQLVSDLGRRIFGSQLEHQLPAIPAHLNCYSASCLAVNTR